MKVTDLDHAFAADVLEEFWGATLDEDKMTELIGHVAATYAFVRERVLDKRKQLVDSGDCDCNACVCDVAEKDD